MDYRLVLGIDCIERESLHFMRFLLDASGQVFSNIGFTTQNRLEFGLGAVTDHEHPSLHTMRGWMLVL